MHFPVVVSVSKTILWCKIPCFWCKDKIIHTKPSNCGCGDLLSNPPNFKCINQHVYVDATVIMITSMRTDVRSVLLHVSGVHKQTDRLPVCVIYARPHIPVIPDFPSDIPAVYWNFVYLVSHCVWDLLSTCETRSVPVKGVGGEQPAVTSQTVNQNFVFGELGFFIR